MVEIRRDPATASKYVAMQAGMTVSELQEKRYAAKILTLLFRDFLNAETAFKKLSKAYFQQVYTLTLKCLAYYIPYYLKSITFN